MKLTKRVAWSEGLLMLPQHLQQADRYHESLVDARLQAFDPLSWGVVQVELDEPALRQEGKLLLRRLVAVLPDGTPVAVGEGSPHPAPEARPVAERFPASQTALEVRVALPEERPGVSNYGAGADGVRYQVGTQSLPDLSVDDHAAEVALASPNLLVRFGGEDLDGLVSMPIAEIVRTDRGELAPSSTYVPPILRLSASPLLLARLRRLHEHMMVRYRALAESRRQTAQARVEFNAADVTRYLQLHAISGALPVVQYAAQVGDLGPRALFLLLLQMVGQLAPFDPDADVSQPFDFDYFDLRASFEPVLSLAERLLNVSDDEQFVACELTRHGADRFYGDLRDDRLAECKRFLLAVQSDRPRPEVVQAMVDRAKLASAADLDVVVQTNIGGLSLAENRRPPPQVPVKPDVVYFDLPAGDDEVYWKHVWADRDLVVWVPASLEPDKLRIRLLGLLD